MVEFTQHQARLLTEARLSHLSTTDSQDVPHVIPLCYAFDERAIYSILDQKPKRTALVELKRVRNIQSNPRVALVVDHYSEDWQNLWYLLVHGDALVLEPGREQAAAVGLLRQKYRQYQGMDIDRNPVIKIIPHRVVSWSGATGRV
jgi:PPOX class probable F420-dependent enzyme